MTCTWNTPDMTEILLTKSNGSLVLKEGVCITYDGRELGVRIETIPKNSEGPIGFNYLPWRGDRWATVQFSIVKGNLRRIVCYPTGLETWGQHINWETVEIISIK